MNYSGVIDKYKKYLPVTDKTPVITLYEGNTPLLRAYNLEKKLKFNFELYLKCEGFNPTGSFKDRGMTVAVSKAKEQGAKIVLCASTGNTAASASAYAAKANLKCIVLIPEKAIALGKLSQAMMHGAEVLAVKGNFDIALKIARELTEKFPITLVNSINPYRIEGQKTAAFEIIDFLGKVPDFQYMPVGNAGNITAYWKGYKEYSKKYKKLPKMMGFQAKGASPIVIGKPVRNPQTIATAIRIGNPASWQKAIQARDESCGVIDTVTDSEIIQAYKLLANTEGIFVELASAASLAGLIKYKEKKYLKNSVVVCILTGHGLKDPDNAVKLSHKPVIVEPELKAVMKKIKF